MGALNQEMERIEHIVVLMLENRSFDHMLGYLSLSGMPEVDGQKPPEDPHFNVVNGDRFNAAPLQKTVTKPGPEHGFHAVAEQLRNSNAGFAANYASAGGKPADVMGYYTGETLKAFDSLARQYLVCDRWFSSMPGPTLPNRLFAMAGHSDGRTEILPFPVTGVDVVSVFQKLEEAGVPWRYYSHDVAYLRTVKRYNTNTTFIRKVSEFYDHCKDGTLPAVSWIDPNFTLQESVGFGLSNDDHPPADVRRGQNLVARIYNSLLLGNAGKLWPKTLFIVTYDEHGGFYDHVSPDSVGPAPAPDGKGVFSRYGVRVPALVMSPWVPKGRVAKAADGTKPVFDHASLIRTILERFCANGPTVPSMKERVDKARSVWSLLSLNAPRTDCQPAPMCDVFELPPVFHGLDQLGIQPTDLQNELGQLRGHALANGVPPNRL